LVRVNFIRLQIGYKILPYVSV